MNYQRILVPYDGSKHAQSALSTACALARESEKAQVYVLHVAPINMELSTNRVDFPESVSPIIDSDGYLDLFDRALNAVEKETRDYAVTALDGLPEAQLIVDVVTNPSPVRAITEYAEGHDCDLIVMGRRGLGALRGMLGSVSFGVLRSVDIPVLTVK